MINYTKIKQKYQALRDQKIRERVEQLGVTVEEGDDRSVLLEKERQEFAAMTPEELAAFEAKMKRADARAAAMIEGLNAYTAKK